MKKLASSKRKGSKSLGQTMSLYSIWFSTVRWKLMAYWSAVDTLFLQSKYWCLIYKKKRIWIDYKSLLLYMFAFANSPCSLVSILALLLVVLWRMFSHHMYLKARRCGALLVAAFTGKRLLTSVRPQVSFWMLFWMKKRCTGCNCKVFLRTFPSTYFMFQLVSFHSIQFTFRCTFLCFYWYCLI